MSNFGMNDLQFNIEDFDLGIRKTLKKYLKQNDVVDYFGSEVYVVPFEVDIVDKSKLPAVEIDIINEGTVDFTQEDTQIQYMNNISVEINTYTTGSDKKKKNVKLANYIIDILQSSQQISTYYCRGLKLQSCRRLSSIDSSVDRIFIRFTATCDNNLKLIYSK